MTKPDTKSCPHCGRDFAWHPAALTGTEIKKLRESARLSASKLARTLGVSISTVFRWQACEGAAPLMEPRNMEYLMALKRAVARAKSPPSLGAEISKALIEGGGVQAMYVLLRATYALPA